MFLQNNYKQQILDYLEKFLQQKSQEFSLVNSWGEDIEKRLLPFLGQGKMIRGSLVFFSYSLFAKEDSENILPVAAAIELMHASLVVHDDIMDQDFLRRGQPSIFHQYQQVAEKKNFTKPLHFGESMGICFGDIGFFLGYELLAKTSPQLMQLFSKELSSVVLAQMQDVDNGFSTEDIKEENILSVYTYKTGRYTFSLPLIAGALLAKQHQEIIDVLEKIGMEIGLLFQLRDDELGLFGSEKELGKPIGSDIRENKKTMYRLLLFQKASNEQKQKLQNIFGNKNITTNDLAYIHDLCEELDVRKEMQTKMETIEKNAREHIKKLPITDEKKNMFFDVITFVKERKK